MAKGLSGGTTPPRSIRSVRTASPLTVLAFDPRFGGMRRIAVALAALVEARRRWPDLPDALAIARGERTLEEVSRLVQLACGAPLPGVTPKASGAVRMPVLPMLRRAGAPGSFVAPLRAFPPVRPKGGPVADLAVALSTVDWERVDDPAGRVLQEFRAAEDRKRHGAFFTPDAIVDRLLDALPIELAGARVLDPACGSGAFLVAAARRKAIACGADVDEDAVAVTRFRLALTGGLGHDVREASLLESDGPFEGPFDAVIGNPPYVRFHNLDEVTRLSLRDRFATATGQFDLFAPFLELALAHAREDGAVAFVLPALLLRGARYRELRAFLLARANVVEVVELGDGVFDGVLAPTCILVLQRQSRPRTARVQWTPPHGESIEVDEATWRRDPQAAFAPVAAAATTILAKLDGFTQLAVLADLGRGEEIGKRHAALGKPAEGRTPCVTGSDVSRYRVETWRGLDASQLPSRRRNETRARVLVRETGSRLTAVAVEAGVVSTRSLFHVVPHGLPVAYLLGWLNSALAQWWFATCVRADSGIFPKLRIGQLGSLRIPTDPALVAEIAALATARTETNGNVALVLERAIDEAIFDFLGLTAEERRTILAARGQETIPF